MDPTIPTARICAMGKVIPAEKQWLDPQRPGARNLRGGKPITTFIAELKEEGLLDEAEARSKFLDVGSILLADGPHDWSDIRFCAVAPGKPAIVIDWSTGGKSVSDLSTDATPEEVVDSLRRQRKA